MRKTILGATSVLALASPAAANGVTPYSEVPSYGAESPRYEYGRRHLSLSSKHRSLWFAHLS
jgi:hypothetical protein